MHKKTNKDLYSPEIDEQTRLRIQISMAAYAYEIIDTPIMDDATFDAMAKLIDVSIDTRRPDLDEFFRKEFSPHTGQWIHNHPDIDKIAWLVESKLRSGAHTNIATYQN